MRVRIRKLLSTPYHVARFRGQRLLGRVGRKMRQDFEVRRDFEEIQYKRFNMKIREMYECGMILLRRMCACVHACVRVRVHACACPHNVYSNDYST